jgi:hypothetical protein
LASSNNLWNIIRRWTRFVLVQNVGCHIAVSILNDGDRPQFNSDDSKSNGSWARRRDGSIGEEDVFLRKSWKIAWCWIPRLPSGERTPHNIPPK